MPYTVQDAALNLTLALPNGAASTTSSAIDLGNGTKGDFVAPMELLVDAPAMGATPMPDNKTMIYDIIHSVNSDLSSPATLIPAFITQTGASSAGCAAAQARLRLPSTVRRYIGLKATGSASGNASSATATLKPQF